MICAPSSFNQADPARLGIFSYQCKQNRTVQKAEKNCGKLERLAPGGVELKLTPNHEPSRLVKWILLYFVLVGFLVYFKRKRRLLPSQRVVIIKAGQMR